MLYKRLIIDGQEYPLAVAQAGHGAPCEDTPGCEGLSYLDIDTGIIYTCVNCENGCPQWRSTSVCAEFQYNEETNVLQWRVRGETEWNDLLSLADLQGAVIAETLQAAENATNAAAASAEAASNAMASAASSASIALESANTANADADRAQEAATSAAANAANAESSAKRAEECAESVDAEALNAKIEVKADNLYYDTETGLLYLTSNGQIIGDGIKVATGGGGGGGSLTFTMTLTNLLDSRVITVPEGETVVLKFNYSSVDDEGMDDGPGIGQVLVGGVARHPFTAVQGENSVDITSYLASGTNNISIRVTNSENASKSLVYTVTVATVYLASTFDASIPYSGAIPFVYTPTGIAEKTVHFELDGAEIGKATVTTSGRQQSYTIPAQSHGSHILRVWFTCDVSGVTISSNVLYYSLICVVDGNTAPIIAVTSPPLTGVEQFSNIVKKYRVYNPASLTSAITLEVDGKVVSNLTVDRTEQTWTYRADMVGEISQTIRCGDVYISWTQKVVESTIKVEAETEALALYLSSYGRSNNEDNPGIWKSEAVECEFHNFNFVSDGWVQDEHDITVLRVTGDARLIIPYKMFAYDFRTTGKTLEFELATREVLNYDAVVLSCYSGGRGFVITAQQLSFTSEQSSMGTRYKEDEHIRISIVAEKKSESRLLMCYINGILSGAIQYPEDDDFSQVTPVGI